MREVSSGSVLSNQPVTINFKNPPRRTYGLIRMESKVTMDQTTVQMDPWVTFMERKSTLLNDTKGSETSHVIPENKFLVTIIERSKELGKKLMVAKLFIS